MADAFNKTVGRFCAYHIAADTGSIYMEGAWFRALTPEDLADLIYLATSLSHAILAAERHEKSPDRGEN